MMRQLIVWLMLMIPTLAQIVPTENPSEVWVKGRKVDHSWRNGRIWVPTSELKPLLNLAHDQPATDLLEALEAKGGYIWTIEEGIFRASRDPSRYSSTPNKAQSRGRAASSSSSSKKGARNQLTAAVQKFVAEETGYVRAWVQVTNSGSQPNDPSLMIVEFQDHYHYAWAKDQKAVPSMKPGESMVYECFSMVPDEIKNIDGVQRTINGDQVVCKFRSLTNPENDNQDTIRKEERRGRKIEVSPIKTSPLPAFTIGK